MSVIAQPVRLQAAVIAVAHQCVEGVFSPKIRVN